MYMSKSNIHYYIIIFVLYIVIFLTIFYIFKYKMLESMQVGETWFITFGGPSINYRDAVKRLTDEVHKTQSFDHIIGYTDEDLKNDPEFWDSHGELAEATTWHRGGYGYWIWKPYLILKTMQQMNDNDIVLYMDAGCTIKNNDEYKTKYEDMQKLINKCAKNDILFTSSDQLERHYSKMDLVKYLEMDSIDVLNSTQYQATILFIKKTEQTHRFVKKWYNIMSNNYELIDGSPSQNFADLKDYKETRNDQSVFSLLAKKYGIDESCMLPLEKHDPILISRRRSG